MLYRMILGLVFAALPLGAGAEIARTLTWSDLVPRTAPLDDPLAEVDIATRYDLGFIAQVLADAEKGAITTDGAEYRSAMATLEGLKARGIDTDRLVAAVAARDAEIERRNNTIRTDLDGAVVRMPGYALPLEVSEAGVTEFLLVPYVGACIHVPPPPPNQIVYVTLPTSYRMEGLYEPVWITGRLVAEQASRALSYVDGQAQVATGYRLAGTAIEPYE